MTKSLKTKSKFKVKSLGKGSKRPDKPTKKVKTEEPSDDALNSFKNIIDFGNDEFQEPENGDSDDDGVDGAAHNRLLNAINQLQRTQHISVPTRTEITDKKSEFDLVKSSTEGTQRPDSARVTLAGLVESLKKTQKHDDIRKQLTNLQRNSKKLPKPLEKPVAEKIARGIAYEKARSNLDRWDAVVEKSRVEDTLQFPLVNTEEVILVENTPREPLSYRIKSDLMMELEKLEPPKEIENKYEKEETMKRMREELLDQRREMAKVRRKESYEIEKARRQNKIKSKKFHKVLKKEKIKKQLAEFEELQKTDPEAALKQLEKIEQTRLEERAHLRHRNTGTWAKNLQVRAKFDKDARQELHQQIEIGRELKRKQNEESSSDEEKEDKDQDESEFDPFNPWIKNSQENGEEFSGYRKYWDERNKNEEMMREFNNSTEIKEDASSEEESNNELIPEQKVKEIKPKKSKKIKKAKRLSNGFEVEEISDEDDKKTSNSDKQLVETLDDLFDEAEEKVNEHVSKKVSKLKKSLENFVTEENHKNYKKKDNSDTDQEKSNLKFKSKTIRPDLDEKMVEESRGADKKSIDEPKSLKKLLEKSKTSEQEESEKREINPNKFISIEPKHLKTAFPDQLNDEGLNDSDNEEEDHRLTIAAAFEDDDIVMDFRKEKDDKIKEDQPEDVNLTLPGWGSWTGTGVKEKPKSRFILKFPKQLPRKDDKKEKLILNEKVSDKLKEHLVSDLPFPFTSVKDYESSIRAPITRTFVPETAHRVLTKSAVVTKMGTIIQPMDESSLLQQPKRYKTKTDLKLEEIDKNKIAV